jgi:RNA polymerase sigma factor (sigma-70 family)
VATRSDSPSVGRHDDEHLRRFIAARKRGDAVEMRRWWDELVIDFFDRMDGFVALAHKGRLDHDEHEVAVQMSMARFSARLIDSYEGVSMGELVNACKTLANGICMDVQRSEMRAHRKAKSLDAGWDADAEDRPSQTWEADDAWHRFERAERSTEVQDFLAGALPQIIEDRRRVLELSFEGASIAEICEELGITEANAYQRRSRAFKDLKTLKERYDA